MAAFKAVASVCVMVGVLASTAHAVNIETVPVGDPGNAGDTRYGGSYGAVGYTYSIGKYEVTAGQYVEFLNKTAKIDTYGLYNASMWMDTTYGCGIQQSGTSGSYTYSVASNYANRPVNYVSWGDSARFANWMSNGQPTGVQNASTTEDGSYVLNGATSDAALLAVTRKANATWVIPSEDEWYKSAYHKNEGVTSNYFDYPMSSDSGNTGMANYGYSVGRTTDVGSYRYASPYGTFDQGGNVWEWNEAVIYGSDRGLRGGSFDNGNDIVILHASFRNGCIYPASEYRVVGFRVSEVPEPATLSLLALGALALMRRGHRTA